MGEWAETAVEGGLGAPLSPLSLGETMSVGDSRVPGTPSSALVTVTHPLTAPVSFVGNVTLCPNKRHLLRESLRMPELRSDQL